MVLRLKKAVTRLILARSRATVGHLGVFCEARLRLCVKHCVFVMSAGFVSLSVTTAGSSFSNAAMFPRVTVTRGSGLPVRASHVTATLCTEPTECSTLALTSSYSFGGAMSGRSRGRYVVMVSCLSCCPSI